MASKKNNPAKNTPVAPAKAAATPLRKPAAQSTAPAAQKDGFISRYYEWLVVAGISLLTYLFFKEILNNQLTNWDDLGYIITNPLIKDPSMEGLRKIFSIDNPVMGNYHPLTIMLYWIEYSHYGLEPWIYHFDSLICHILVTIAVYLFVRILTRRPVAAAVAAILFGLHPMHVETVAWAAGRKDMIYGLFYILSLMCYVYYLRSAAKNKKILWYSATIILFALSLLAKSVGVTLPITFFLIDLLEGRTLFTGGDNRGGIIGDRENGKFNYLLFLEKIPHLGLAILFGVLSIYAQKNIGALGTLDVSFTPFERIAIAGYNVCTYLWKAVIPVGMCNFYPYPLKEANDTLSVTFYIYPLLVLGLLFAVWWFGRKNKILIFGLGFFFVNIVLLLQLIPVGGAVMSDRYTYLPYLGLFVIAGWFVSGFFEGGKNRQTGYALLAVTFVYSMIYGYLTTQQCKVWYDSISLWNNDIEKHPANPVSYFYLGQEYYSKFETEINPKDQKRYQDSAQICFMASIERKPDYINPIVCLAELQRATNQIDAAKATYFQAMRINEAHTTNKIQNKDESVFLGLGVIYSIKRQYDSAEYCFKEALRLKAYFPEAYSNYANFLDITGKQDSSLKYYAIAISQNPDAVIPYMNRARIMMLQNKPEPAIADYNKVIALKPEKADAYYLRSKAYNALGKKQQALQDVEKAKALGYPNIDATYYQSLKS
jgi:tetratricopeptide (TPR) repeat protein